jgi:hypothetical protein
MGNPQLLRSQEIITIMKLHILEKPGHATTCFVISLKNQRYVTTCLVRGETNDVTQFGKYQMFLSHYNKCHVTDILKFDWSIWVDHIYKDTFHLYVIMPISML